MAKLESRTAAGALTHSGGAPIREPNLSHLDRSLPEMHAAGKPLRLLIVCEGFQSAVALMRGFQFRELFARHPDYDATFVCRTSPLAGPDDRRWYRLAIRKVLAGPIYRAFVRRQEDRIVRLARESDLVYAIGVPSLRLHERLCVLERPRVVMDMIDGLWLPYHRQFGWDALEQMLEMSAGVVCENEYTATFARRYNGAVHILPNAPQLDVFDAWRDRIHKDPDRVVLGWVGTRDMVASLYAIWEPLEELFSRHSRLHLRIVGGAAQRLPLFEKVRHSLLPSYDQEQMVREVLAMDIGLFPLFRVEDSLTRGSSKARIYMSGGAVAACQDFGHSRSLIEDRVNGVLAGTHEEWFEKLDWLIRNPEERNRIARRGLETVRENFSTARCFERLTDVLRSYV